MKLRLLIIVSLVTFAVNAQENVATEEETVYNSTAGLQTQPQYPGGIDAFYNDLLNSFDNSVVDKIKGKMSLRVLLTFVVEKDGTMSSIKVVKDPGYGLGEEAVKALKKIDKKWQPGIQNGKTVRAMYTLPMTINTD